jgi:hypothetical protein
VEGHDRSSQRQTLRNLRDTGVAATGIRRPSTRPELFAEMTPNADTEARYSCEACGCTISRFVSLGGVTYWADTRGNSPCPSWTAAFHAPNPVALALPPNDSLEAGR